MKARKLASRPIVIDDRLRRLEDAMLESAERCEGCGSAQVVAKTDCGGGVTYWCAACKVAGDALPENAAS